MKFSLKGIIAIAGKPGLYKVLAQGANNIIVESLIDKKRFPASSSSKISSLEEITMYTTDEDMPLHEIIQKIFEKENGGAAVDPKDEAKHRSYFKEIVPNFDEERVYGSDIKKLFNWYALLNSSGELKRIAEEAAKAIETPSEQDIKENIKEEITESKKEEKATEPKKEKAKAKTGTKTAKSADAKPKIKTESKSKVATVRKTGGQRGA